MAKRSRRSQPNLSEAETLPTEQLVEPFDQADLITEIQETAQKLVRDQATRGDCKLISRALKELRYAFKVFKPLRKQRKVTVFGSARTAASHPAFIAAEKFGKLMAAEGWFVVTGAGNGIMEAGHRGAGADMSIGLNILLPFEQEANTVVREPLLINLKYFFTRKLLFVKEVHAVALFPGGFGTMDEGFETLTLVQTGKRDPMPIVLVDEPGGTYWRKFHDFVVEELLNRALISPADMSLFRVTDSVEEAVEEIMQFYSVYHSLRYVRKQLVLRLNNPVSDAQLEQLNTQFADITEAGRITRSDPLPQEADDAHIAHLPRLVFQFNRRDFGRLREMIDVINTFDGR